jgi:hypothetical protein
MLHLNIVFQCSKFFIVKDKRFYVRHFILDMAMKENIFHESMKISPLVNARNYILHILVKVTNNKKGSTAIFPSPHTISNIII